MVATVIPCQRRKSLPSFTARDLEGGAGLAISRARSGTGAASLGAQRKNIRSCRKRSRRVPKGDCPILAAAVPTGVPGVMVAVAVPTGVPGVKVAVAVPVGTPSVGERVGVALSTGVAVEVGVEVDVGVLPGVKVGI